MESFWARGEIAVNEENRPPSQLRPKPSSGRERRGIGRSRIVMSAKIGLLFPEDSPEPQPWTAVVKNISPRGMMLEILGLDQATYQRLLGDERHVLVYLPVGGAPKPMELKGKVVWLDYLPQNKPRELCNLGLYFESMSDIESGRLRALFEEASRRPDTTY